MPRRIRVLVADDFPVVRSGLRRLIDAEPDMAVVGEADDAASALAMTLKTKPDVVLMDLSMPGASVTSLIAEVARRAPEAIVLVLTMHDDPAYARAALENGALGFLTKKASGAQLLQAIRSVFLRRAYVDVDLASVLARPASLFRTRKLPSGREREVLKMVALGHTNRETAERLGVGVKSVETYRARVAQKLGLRTRADFVRYGIEAGLLRPPEEEPPQG